MTTHIPSAHDNTWQKFVCSACGYIYNEALGSLESGLPVGTRFETIAEHWQCPLCGVKKSGFEPYGDCVKTAPTPAVSEKADKGVVIVGAGLAGWSVVEALRALDKDIPITLICSDSGDRYHKPMLSVAMSQNKTPSDLVRTQATESAIAQNVQLLAHTLVSGIDNYTRCVHSTQGDIAYTDLVLAIGATPAYPPTINQDKVWHINNLPRFADLQARLATGSKNIAIIGAGMIGTEFAEDLVRAGHQVSLIDVSAYPLATMLPQVAGERILSALQELGIRWLGNHKITQVLHTKQGCQMTLLDCQTHQLSTQDFDEIVVATGLVVDEHLPVCAGVAFESKTGIVVNPKSLQTSVPHIYALGDCISIDGVPCRYVAPHRPQATAIAHEILNLSHAGYAHKPPMIRLKNKCINVTANGNPVANGNWQIIQDTPEELVLQMMVGDEILAKATLKAPIAPV